MKISVGMIAYNAGPLIEAAIRSTYPYVAEVIVIDGSRLGPSTDDTKKLAESVGDRVRVISGVFAKPDGSWDEQGQRQAYMNEMKRGSDYWGLFQDADEVYIKGDLLRLISYMLEAKPETLVLSHGFIHLWRTLNQLMVGGQWSRPRDVCAFRLTEMMTQTDFCHVGECEGEHLGQNGYRAQVLKDVFSMHYGHAMPYERLLFKVQEYFLAGYYPDRKGQSLEKFLIEYRDKIYTRSDPNVKPYLGEQPEAILPLIGSYFK